MRSEDVSEIVDGVPSMDTKQGRTLYDFFIEKQVRNALELGFAHGTGSCYMAAALQETGGKLICIDNQSARNRTPSISEQLEKTGLADYVQPVFSDNSYTWELMKLIREHTKDGKCEPFLDFCYIDGAHAWEPDGLAFFLVDKLLKVDGWILFDDIFWTFAESSSRNEDWVTALPEDQRTLPHINLVFDLLVQQHPNYAQCQIVDWWGWARKVGAESLPDECLARLGVQESASGKLKRALRPVLHAVRRKLT